MEIWHLRINNGPSKERTGHNKRQSFIFSYCSGWVGEEEKDIFFFLPLSISPWFCQSVLIQPLCSLADSSTIPSEMLIWQLTVPASAFPCFASQVHISRIRSLFPSVSLLFCPLCLLLQACTKAEFSSALFKIPTNLREGQRSCSSSALWDGTQNPSHILVNTTRQHKLPTPWPFFSLCWEEPIWGTFLHFACG